MANHIANILFFLGVMASGTVLAQSPWPALAVGLGCGAIWAVAGIRWPTKPRSPHIVTPAPAKPMSPQATRWIMLAAYALPLVAGIVCLWLLPAHIRGMAYFMIGVGLALLPLMAAFAEPPSTRA